MNIHSLFQTGISFDKFMSCGSIEHRNEMYKVYTNVEFSAESVVNIRKINEQINVLVCAEIESYDSRVIIPVLEKMKAFNNKIEYSILHNNKYNELFKLCSPDGKTKIPLFIFCNKQFDAVGVFVGQPQFIKDLYFKLGYIEYKKEMDKYQSGLFGECIAKEILEITIVIQ